MRRLLERFVSRWRPYFALIAAMARAGRLLTATLALVILVRTLAPVGFVLATASVIARVPRTITEGLDSSAGRGVLIGIALIALTFFLQQIGQPVQQSVAYMLGNRFHTSIEERFMRAANRPPGIAHLEEPELHNSMTAATRGLGGWPNPADAPNGLAGRITAQLSFAGSALLLAVWHWWVAVPVLVCGLWQQSRLITSLTEAAKGAIGSAEATRRSIYYRELTLTPPAAKEIRIFGLGNWLVDRYKKSFDDAVVTMTAERSRQQRPLLISTAITCGLMFAALLLLGWEAGSGRLELGIVAVAVQALATSARPLTDNQTANSGLILVFAMQALALVQGAEERLRHVPSALTGTLGSDALPAAEIRFEDVSFRYPGQERDVLSGLNLSVPSGQSLAIVGANGAGKTTLIKLLCRLYEPSEGRITVDGVDLRDIDPAAWQRRIAAIFQDYVKYPLSAADNVSFDAQPNDGSGLLQRTADKVGITPVLEALPQGWQTTLSREYEGGVDLSGGEWQRVALARALYAAGAGASVLILDEPTASLDVRGEAEIYDHFLELTGGLTTLLISHRFSTVRKAERICVLEDGHVIEEGDHASLIVAHGRYAELFNLQAARFAEEEQDSDAAPEVAS